MSTTTTSTGILIPFRKGFNGLGNIKLAIRQFDHDRPGAVATEIHVHHVTARQEGLNAQRVRQETGLKFFTDLGRERHVLVIGLEAAE